MKRRKERSYCRVTEAKINTILFIKGVTITMFFFLIANYSYCHGDNVENLSLKPTHPPKTSKHEYGRIPLPKPVTKNNYDKIIKRIHKATKDVAEQTMEEACKEIRGDAGPEEIINTPVSGDGTWQRRGHSSLNGVMTVISMDTGKILDVEAMCWSCKSVLQTKSKTGKGGPRGI